MTISDFDRARAGVEAVAQFMEVEFMRQSPFHLASCGGCGGPSFGQPCAICGYYPMGTNKGAWSPRVATKEIFVEAVRRSGPGGKDGNLATWLLQSEAKLMAYNSPAGQARIADAASRAIDLSLPDAELVWDEVVARGHGLHRDRASHEVNSGWRGAFEVSNLVAQAGNPRISEEWRKAVAEWIAAIHADSREGQVLAVKAMRKVAQNLSDVYPRNGNLHFAREQLRDAEERLLEMGAEAIDARAP